MHNETKRSGFDFSIKTKSRTCRFCHVYNWRDDGSEDEAKEIGGNNYGWPANSEGLPARDHRRVSRKRHRMVRLLYLRELGCGLVGQVLRTESPGCGPAEH